MNLPTEKTDLIVILGSPNADDGRLFDVAIGRCKLASEIYRENPEQRIVLTGGFGEHFNNSPHPHAKLLENYLTQLGVPEHVIVGRIESGNTIEDALLSRDLIEVLCPGVITVVTSDYHKNRAEYVFKTVLGKSYTLKFRYSETNPDESELDIRALTAHEARACEKLEKVGIDGYYC